MSRNAIIMAAGMSTRFVPLSMEVPKALLRVKGEILIERQIKQLREAGIDEIVVVVGYLKEKYKYLAEKYGVILIENQVYQTRNNHSSLYVAREFLKDTFICSGDNYFLKNVFLEKSEISYYASEFAEGKTDEWCLKTSEDNRIEQVDIGGYDSWVMKGHVYFTKEFSKKLIPHLVEAYHEENKKDMFWEEIYMEHMNELELHIKKYEHGILQEFDSIEELRAFDNTYLRHSECKVMEKICEEIHCEESEIVKIEPIKKNGIVIGFRFASNDQKYKYLFETSELTKEQ